MIHHVFGLFTHPDREWRDIRGERQTIAQVFATHVLLLAAIPAIAAFIGTTQVGWVIGSRPAIILSPTSAAWMAALSYLAMLGGVAVMGAFIQWMARAYAVTPGIAHCIAFASYTGTPLFLGGLAALYPHLWLGMLVGTVAICYTVYLLYVGVPTYMNIPADEGFLLASSILAVGLVVLVTLMSLGVLIWGLGMVPAYGG